MIIQMEQKMYELTNPQKSIWLTEQYFQNTTINNICGSLIIKQDTDLNILNKAINIFVKNNDSFKLRFKQNGSELEQYFSKDEDFNFEILNIIEEKQIEVFAKKIVDTKFSIIDSRVFDFKLFKLSSGFGGFIVNVHHIISDAATFSLIGTEIVEIYSKLINNEDIPTKTYSYIDYINSEKEYLKSPRFEKDKIFWTENLNPLPEIATVSTVKNVANINDYKAKRSEFSLNCELISKIKDYCTQNKVSIFNFLIGVYSIYLGRINNMDNFLIGTPILNRTNYAEKHTSGMYISTSLLNINMELNLPFTEFVKNIAIYCMKMLRHQKYNYQHIIDDIRKKDNTISNLYDVLLSYQITKATDTSIGVPYSTKWYGTDYIANSLDVHFHDNDSTGNLLIEYDYRANKYLKSDIEDIHNRILNIIDQVLDNGNININDIEIISTNEKNDLMSFYDNNIKQFNYCHNIFDQIKLNSKDDKKNIAIETECVKITYEELINRVNKLSNYLKNKKLSHNIGIFTNRNIDTIIGILAIINVGSTYVPIDPEYPLKRINYMIENSNIDILLTTNSENMNLLDDKNIDILNIDYSNYKNLSIEFTYPILRNLDDNLYIVFTSGSTGNPKGITISHKNMLNLIYFEKECSELFDGKPKRILQFATMSFDVSYQEIFSSLLTGSCLVLTTEAIRKDMTKLSNYIFDKKIDTLFIPPAYLRILTEDKLVLNKLKVYLKNVITAGEQLVITDGIKNLISNGIKVHNHYGPAETHVATTFVVDSKNIEIKPPIGTAISNSFVYILDKNKHLCPNNVVGEIAIAGDCVGNGYINNENLNKSKFIYDFRTNKKMYLTGDLGYIDEKHIIHYLGRSDFQVKINGFRIELEEIDKVLLQNPLVSNAISVIKEWNNKKYIVTYYVSNLDTKRLNLYLKSKLPIYMIPSKLIPISKLPLTLNGKIDKKALPEVSFVENESDFIEPKTDNEIKFASIWKDIFNTQKISTNSDFFELGGDSLLSIKLCALVQEQFGVDINVTDVFETSKFSDLLSLIEKNSKSQITNITKIPEADYYRLSSAEQRIYYSVSMAGENTILYNLPGGIIFNKLPDVKKLENCFEILVNRHEAFRSYFELEENKVVKKILPSAEFKIDLIDANWKDLNYYFEEFVKPFDLKNAPLLRACILKFENGKSALLFDTHHIIVDGTSMKVFIKELCDLYNNKVLPDLKYTYKDFAAMEYTALKNGYMDESKNYWINKFNDDIPVLDLPTKRPRTSTKSFKGAKVYKKINKKTTKKLNELAKKYGVTPFMLTLSIYYILLAKYSTQNDIIIGSPIVGRDNNELNNIIGMFVNTLPLRMNFDDNITFSELLSRVKTICLEGFIHQTYPLDKILDNVSFTRDSSRNPLFDVLFTYQNDGNLPVNINNIKSKYYLPDTKISKFDLSLEIVPNNDELNLNFEYCSYLFTNKFIEDLSEHYLSILNCVIANNDIKLSEIDMLSPKERQIILNDFNDTYLEYPKNNSLVDLFKTQVNSHPNNIAVQFANKKITYKELDEKSNTLAKELLDNNVKNNDIIGIYMNKSIELIVSIWAVLKTGACYMPMFINYPKDRLEYMIQNSDCKIVITKSNLTKNISFNCNTINVDNFETISCVSSIHNIDILPDNLAYIIYTSGSTGRPKGVKITHKCLNNYVHSFNKLFKNIGPQDKLLSSTNISFDVSIWELFLSILNGATLVLYEEEIINNIVKYSNSIVDYGITTLYIPPNILNDVYTILKDKDVKINKLLVGVEPIKRSTLNKFYKLNPNINIINGYGPTETTICSTAFEYKKSENSSKPVSIGKPIGNTKIYIVDKNMHIVPVGVSGELCITGDGVGKGYVNNVETTNKHFVDNVFNKNSNSKMYKTGDLAKWNYDGTINFIGRQDSQIKLSGYRIELKEIDNTILRYPSIIKCLTKLYTRNNSSFLVTYFTATEKINITELNQYLQSKLAFYMVPKSFMQLDSFPLTVNGKIDSKKLPEPTYDAQREYVAPSTPLEKKLCKLWQNLFGTKKIGINDNFFDLGGDSLSAIRLQVEALNKNLNITYADIFSYPTIKLLAKKASNSIENTEQKQDYDYTKINNLLSKNVKENIPNIISTKPIGNILLTGATGFLGAHLLDTFLTLEPNSMVYCIVRNKNNVSYKERLKNTLQFYFGDKYLSNFDQKIKVINTDVTKPNLGLDENKLDELSKNISAVVNSAALVKHYGDYNKFHLINVIGTKNIIDFCKKYDKKLYHISTTSVSGIGLPENNMKKSKTVTYFGEKDLYKGQNLNNTYIKTKFDAEKLVFEETLNGLKACVLRMGNISNRYSDAKFQINANENAFVNRIGYILKLGVLQEGFKEHATEFAPVDLCATAIVKIMQSDPDFNVFHIFNNKLISFSNLIDFINNLGIKLDFVSDKKFSDTVTYFLNDPKLKNEISGIVTDLDSNKLFKLNANILLDVDFSVSYLQKLGFEWPKIDEDYIKKYITYFEQIKLF